MYAHFMNTKIEVICDKRRILQNGEYPLVLRLTKDRKQKYIRIGISVDEKYWDSNKLQFKRNTPNKEYLDNIITENLNKYQKQVLEFQTIGKDYSIQQLIQLVEKPTKNITVEKYLESIIQSLIAESRIGNANHYKALLNSLQRFTSLSQLLFVDLDSAFLARYENYLKGNGNRGNTISIKMRTLRATFNKAIKDNIIKKDYYPFDNYNVSKLREDTVKRSITKEDMIRILNFDVSTITKRPQSLIQFSKDIFLFSYFGCGINMIDISYLKKSDVFEDRIVYRRHKTGKRISFSLQDYAKEIIQKYIGQNGNYLFPILDNSLHKTADQQIKRIKKVTYVVNKNLKKIGEALGLPISLTTYVSRHSFATILKRSGVNIALISEALGHSDLKTTQIYLDSFENSQIDEAMKNLL